MEVYPVKTPLVKVGDDIIKIILDAINKADLKIKDGDIIVTADKIVATSEGRVFDLKTVTPTKRAKEIARKHSLEPSFVELVLREADEFYGGAHRAILTLKNNILIANSGIDRKNAPINKVCLWSVNPNKTANRVWRILKQKTGKKIGFMLIDSHVNPMRVGTVGFALGIAGIIPIKDYRGTLDLYDRSILITRMNLADNLAASAHLIMGESSESTPVVLIRGAPVEIVDNYDPDEVLIPKSECMYMRVFLPEEADK